MSKKKNENKPKVQKPLLRTFGYAKRYKGLIAFELAMAAIYAVAGVFFPIFEGNLLASIAEANEAVIYYNALMALLLFIGMRIVFVGWTYTANKMYTLSMSHISHDLLDSMMRIQAKNLDKTNSGTFFSRLRKDTAEISSFMDKIIDPMSEIVSKSAFLVYIYFISWPIGLFLVGYLAVSSFLFYLELRSKRKWTELYKKDDDVVSGVINEAIRGVRDIKLLGLRRATLEIADEKIDKTNKTHMKRMMWNSSLRRLRMCVQEVMRFGMIALGVYLMIRGDFLPASFLIVFVYHDRINSFISAFFELISGVQDTKIAAERVFEVMDEGDFSKDSYGTEEVELKGHIVFDQVGFHYNPESKLFENLSFEVKSNSTVAICGKSGQGKSTILHLLCKNYDLTEGNILLDGHAIGTLSEKSIKKGITVVPQQPYIFNMSIRENLKMVRRNVSDEEMELACKRAQLHDFIISQPKGYDSLVGENGVVLSGGQKQRLAIARALVKKSNIILLDEATSALDNESQGKIKQAIDELAKDHTILIVAHRLSTIVDADKIIFLEDHKIVAEGTHKELLKTCRQYAQLYQTEAEN